MATIIKHNTSTLGHQELSHQELVRQKLNHQKLGHQALDVLLEKLWHDIKRGNYIKLSPDVKEYLLNYNKVVSYMYEYSLTLKSMSLEEQAKYADIITMILCDHCYYDDQNNNDNYQKILAMYVDSMLDKWSYNIDIYGKINNPYIISGCAKLILTINDPIRKQKLIDFLQQNI